MSGGRNGAQMIGGVPFLVLGLVILCAYSSLASALSLFVPTRLGTFNTEVVSYKEAKFKSIIRQQYDYSCGSAAVASLLSYHYDDTKSEIEVFEAMWKDGDHALIKQQGFSLLDMKRYLENRGYKADGFRLSLDKLKGVGVPAITLINNNGYMHFVVVKGISDKKILLGDPVLGVRVMPRDRFEQQWNNGIIFLIKNQAQIARASFNRDEEWGTIAKAPTDYARSLTARSLADFNLLIPARSDM